MQCSFWHLPIRRFERIIKSSTMKLNRYSWRLFHSKMIVIKYDRKVATEKVIVWRTIAEKTFFFRLIRDAWKWTLRQAQTSDPLIVRDVEMDNEICTDAISSALNSSSSSSLAEANARFSVHCSSVYGPSWRHCRIWMIYDFNQFVCARSQSNYTIFCCSNRPIEMFGRWSFQVGRFSMTFTVACCRCIRIEINNGQFKGERPRIEKSEWKKKQSNGESKMQTEIKWIINGCLLLAFRHRHRLSIDTVDVIFAIETQSKKLHGNCRTAIRAKCR